MKKITGNIYSHLVEFKRVKTYMNNAPTNYDIEQAALNLNMAIKGTPNDKAKGDKAIIDLTNK